VNDDESRLTTADRRVIDRVVTELLRALAAMARGNADQCVSARDCDHLADIFEGKVKPL
jgi:hypothetical protein